MILLVASPGPTRTALTSFLGQDRLYPKVCGTHAAGLETYLKAPVFDLVIVDHRLADGSAQNFMAELARRGYSVPVVVTGAPLRAEAALYRSGAIAVLGAGFSPRSVALQCLNLNTLINRTVPATREVARKPLRDFDFGATAVSPDKRLLRPKFSRGKGNWIHLSKLQVRFLQMLRASPERTLDYESIFHAVWRRAYHGNNGAIRECVSSLRKQFKRAGFDFGRWVTTVHGEGYRYDRK